MSNEKNQFSAEEMQEKEKGKDSNRFYALFGYPGGLREGGVVPNPWWNMPSQHSPSPMFSAQNESTSSFFPSESSSLNEVGKPAEGSPVDNDVSSTGSKGLFDAIIHPPFPYKPSKADSRDGGSQYDSFEDFGEDMLLFPVEMENDDVDNTNVFVKHLPSDIDDSDLRELFCQFGKICSCKVMLNIKTGGSLGYGFIRFADEESAADAIQSMSGHRIGKKKLLCKLSNKSQPQRQKQEPRKNLYIKHLPLDYDDEDLRALFENCFSDKKSGSKGPSGKILEVKVMMDKHTGLSKQIGFVRFDEQKDANFALNQMNGKILDSGGPALAVQYAETANEKRHRQTLQQAKLNALSFRSATTKAKHSSSVTLPFPKSEKKKDLGKQKPTKSHSQTQSSSPQSPQNLSKNVFIFHLPPKVDDEQLYNLFRPFGEVESVRVIIDPHTGQSKGYGFVKYYDVVDAQKAVEGMSGYRLGSKYLKVSFKS